jgi:hypothetical protein
VTGDLYAVLLQFQRQTEVQAKGQADNREMLTTILQALHISHVDPLNSSCQALSPAHTADGQSSAHVAKTNPLSDKSLAGGSQRAAGQGS